MISVPRPNDMTGELHRNKQRRRACVPPENAALIEKNKHPKVKLAVCYDKAIFC